MDVWLFLGLSVIAGTIGAILATALLLAILRLYRPSIQVSSEIARYRESRDGKTYHVIKVINRVGRAAIDIEAELTWIEEVPWADGDKTGFVQYYTEVELVRDKIRVLNRYDSKDDHGLYAFRFRTEEPLRDNWDNVHVRLLFRLIGVDSRSGSMRVFTREYTKLNEPIKDGTFEPGQSMKIISRPSDLEI